MPTATNTLKNRNTWDITDNAACGTHAIVAETFTEGLTDDSGRAPCLGNHEDL